MLFQWTVVGVTLSPGPAVAMTAVQEDKCGGGHVCVHSVRMEASHVRDFLWTSGHAEALTVQVVSIP